MIYKEFDGDKLSQLGFGTMRLPCTADGKINQAEVEQMVDLAMKSGVNYFDTAYPYHGGLSEISIAEALSKYPRESYFLADKYPGHQFAESYNPAEIFEDQLKKCNVEYFDYYLLHNVYEGSVDIYLDPKWGIVDYFKEQKRLGRINHLGFSTHGDIDTMTRFLDAVGADMEFCQIQLNWLDWTLQDAKGKVELLNARNIPIWVMEPLRGGALCKLSEENVSRLKALRDDETTIGWSFRFLQSIKGVTVVLSGMSSIKQMSDNVNTFTYDKPLNEEEMSALLEIAEGLKGGIPCTGCGYCTSSCPMGLNIPRFMATYNELCVDAKTNPIMWLETLPEDKQPSACIGCGACAKMCPQKIDIPDTIADLDKKLAGIPKWKDICREREEAAKKLKAAESKAAEAEPLVRNLTVTREKKVSRLLDKCVLYIEDANGDYLVGGTRCKLIGSVKNGGSSTFEILSGERKLIAVWDSRYMGYNYVILPAEGDVALVGRYDDGLMMFDKIENHPVGNYSSMSKWEVFKAKYLKMILIIGIVTGLSLLMSYLGFGEKGLYSKEKQFETDEFSITLSEEFSESENTYEDIWSFDSEYLACHVSKIPVYENESYILNDRESAVYMLIGLGYIGNEHEEITNQGLTGYKWEWEDTQDGYRGIAYVFVYPDTDCLWAIKFDHHAESIGLEEYIFDWAKTFKTK